MQMCVSYHRYFVYRLRALGIHTVTTTDGFTTYTASSISLHSLLARQRQLLPSLIPQQCDTARAGYLVIAGNGRLSQDSQLYSTNFCTNFIGMFIICCIKAMRKIAIPSTASCSCGTLSSGGCPFPLHLRCTTSSLLQKWALLSATAMPPHLGCSWECSASDGESHMNLHLYVYVYMFVHLSVCLSVYIVGAVLPVLDQ